jgi:hypothetical protein
MLKKMLIVAAAAGVIGAASLPVQAAAPEGAMTCRDAAKLKYPNDRKMRHEFRKACKQAWKAQKNAAGPA